MIRGVAFESHLDRRSPILRDYRIFGEPVVPTGLLLAMVLAGADEVSGAGTRTLAGLTFDEPLTLPREGGLDVQLVLPGGESGEARFEVVSPGVGEDDAWTRHAAGIVRDSEPSHSNGSRLGIEVLQARCPEPMSPEEFDRRIGGDALELGPGFRWFERAWRGEGEAFGQIRSHRPADGEVAGGLHPGLIEASLLLLRASVAGPEATVLEVRGIESFRVSTGGGVARWCHATTREMGEDRWSGDVRLVDEHGAPVLEASGVSLAPARRTLAEVGDDSGRWLYEIEWEPVPRSTPTGEAEAAGRWLLFADQGGTGEALGTLLVDRGGCPLLVVPGEEFRLPDDGTIGTIDPTRPEDFRRLRRELADAGPIAGVVFLWGLDASEADMTIPGSLDESLRRGCLSALSLVQALADEGADVLPRLWLVTREAQAVGGSKPGAAGAVQATLWGLGRVVALEHPGLRGSRIDLEGSATSTEPGELLEELLRGDGEDQVAFRGGVRFVPRLRRSGVAGADHAPARFREDGSYLIAGGLGGLGLQVARWMIGRGARHLVLMSRSGPSDAARGEIADLERSGARVSVARGDVSLESDVGGVLDAIEEAGPPLRGVIHAAGVLDDGVLARQDRGRFARVLSPKVSGAWNLHERTRDLPLDWFVLFSSAASVLGSPGQGNYAAANAFLDALAHHRRGLGLPAMAINWGPWAGSGMAASLDERDRRRQESQGLGAIPPDEGLEILGRLIERGPAQICVVPVDWHTYLGWSTPDNVPPILRDLALEVAESGDSGETGPSELETLLADGSGRDRREALVDHVRGKVAAVLGLSAGSRLDAGRPLMELGLDSLMAIELRNGLARSSRLDLPATLLFDHPSIAAIADFLASELGEVALPPAASPSTTKTDDENRARALDEVEGLSEGELDALISAEFENISTRPRPR